MSPPPQPPTLTGLSADMYPHIMDKIIAAAPFASLLALRAASKDMCTRIDKRLVDVVLLWSDGRMASRLAPHKRLPRHDWDRYPELAEALRIVDVQSGKRFDYGEDEMWNIWDYQTITPPGIFCSCAWAAPNVLDNRLAPYFPNKKIPVLRRFGDHTCGELIAGLGIFFLDPPLGYDDHDRHPNDVGTTSAHLFDCDTAVFHLPIWRSYQLTTPKLITLGDSSTHTVIYRRRAYLPRDMEWLEICNYPESMSDTLAVMFHGCKNPHFLQIVLVDWEGDCAWHEGYACASRSGYPHYSKSRSELLEQVKHWTPLLDSEPSKVPEMIEGENVLFLSTENNEYREHVGETAFRLEEDDHGFEFPPDDV